MKVYLVTVTKSAGIGYAHIPTTYTVIADTVYKARRQASRLDAVKRPGLPEIISIHAHAVKYGETVPAITTAWAYDTKLCARARADYVADVQALAAEIAAEPAPAAEPETETTAETETTEGAAEINPMCADCTRRGTDCDGTTCKTWTGCIYRIGLGSSKRSETPAHITDAATAKLLDYWDYVRHLSYSAATAMTRGWILDEIERRDPIGYARWVDDDTPGDYDARLRGFIRCDDARVAWLCPQTETTWHPGDARKGARA